MKSVMCGKLTAQRLHALNDFKAGRVDYLLATDLASRGLDIKGVETVINYDMPGQLAQYLCDRSEPPYPTLHTLNLTFPMSHAEIVHAYRMKIQEIKGTHAGTKYDIGPSNTNLEGKGNRIIAIIDAIVCNPGLYMPWKEIVNLCRQEGVWSVVDAAHSIGQEVC